ncbi:toll/interleukin-1 receptor domain-containing protein [Saccharothrix deserti]|uniref:toll/interleukin-1 receptor domain-containing protein n=1 Tax=Saccharothrix deserti TaxID=2593674 RepID=UPI00131AB8EE|nr:toll/interleukin-1 receptor domain-containing protein [Saccharothrix deserti]
MTTGTSPGHVFLSYVREDERRVGRLQHLLEAADLPVWRDTDNLWPGQDWKLEISKAIGRGSFAFIVCFSEHSAARDKSYQNEELVLAAEQMRLRRPGKPWLIPVRFAEVDVPHFSLGAGRMLSDLQGVDLVGDNWESGAVRLTTAIKMMLAA